MGSAGKGVQVKQGLILDQDLGQHGLILDQDLG